MPKQMSSSDGDTFLPASPRLHRLLLSAVSALPGWALGLLARLLFLLRWLGARKGRRILLSNIEEIFRLPPHSSFARAFARQVMHGQIVVALESIKGIFQTTRLTLDGFAELLTHMRQVEGDNGQLVVTAHLGSWELVGHFCAQATERPFYALAKPPRRTLVTALLAEMRQKMGTRVLWTGSKALPRQMLQVLRTGAWLGFVMDQKPRGRQGPLVRFFDRPTPFVAGPAMMAVKERRPVVAVFCVRTSPFHYRLLSKVLLPAGHQEDDPLAVTQLMASELERVIRLYPEQWCWDYKRWVFPTSKPSP